MTNEDIKAIQEIQGTAGFRVIQYLAEQKLDKLDRVSTLGTSSNTELDFSAAARRDAVLYLMEFLKEINLLPKEEKEKRRTYE